MANASQFEQDYSELSADITAKIGRIPSLFGKVKHDLVSEISRMIYILCSRTSNQPIRYSDTKDPDTGMCKDLIGIGRDTLCQDTLIKASKSSLNGTLHFLTC